MTFAPAGQEERAFLYQYETNTWGLRGAARLLAGGWHSPQEDV
jgi:hypothetical protein